MTMNLTANDLAPELAGSDENVTVDIYVAPFSYGLTHESTADLRRAGSLSPGTYDVTSAVTTNKTMLGSQKVNKNTHINALETTFSGTFNELTPYGQNLAAKTDTPLLFSLSATLYTVTSAALQSLTLATVSGLSVGNMLQAYGSGTNAAPMESKIASINGSMVTFETPFDDTPGTAIAARKVTKWVNRWTGGRMQKNTFISKISGDEGTTMIHEVLKGQVASNKNAYPDANIATNQFTWEALARKITREDGKIVPEMFQEIVYTP
jgi:hypothetical protein